MKNKLSGLFADERNIEEETDLLMEMMKFNWAEHYEIFMQTQTNDLGEFLSPQATFVLFSEFVKFMFLNYVNIRSLKRLQKHPVKFYEVGDTELKVYTSLAAPYYIDLVYLYLLSTQKYQEFSTKFFNGGFLERLDPIENSKSLQYEYQTTLNLLETYKDVMFPLYNIWSQYSKDWYLFDIDNTISITIPDLYKLKGYLLEKLREKLKESHSVNSLKTL